MTVDVVVVGAGPSGLFAAAELARHEVRPRVVEREPERHHEARATAIQPGTLEILDRAGLVERFLEAGVHLPFARVFDADLQLVSEMAFAGAGSRWEFQCSLPQWRTEEILLDRLGELGVEVERGVAASAITPNGDRLGVELTRSDGTTEAVQPRYVIGAGGAHSITRSTLDEILTGETYPGTALVADVRVRCGLPRNGGALVATAEGYVLLAPLPEERWITFVGDLDEDEIKRLSDNRSGDAVAAALTRRIRGGIELEEIAWAALFQMHNRVVSRLAGERRFLLGDAGHLSSPFGGEGLNSGLHDGHNLAWKLALALRGRARSSLLDSFASERLTADRHVLEVSDRLHAFAHAAVESARTGAKPAPLSPAEVTALVRSRSMLDVTYAGSPIVGEYRAPRAAAIVAPGADPAAALVAGARYPHRLAPSTLHRLVLFAPADEAELSRLRARWEGALDVVEAGSVPDDPSSARGMAGATLVRPDGHIGFRAETTDAAALAALDEHLESYLVPR